MPADTTSLPPTGRQWRISHSGYSATLVESGGGIRELTLDGAPVLSGYALDEVPAGGRGQVLMPWPNRVRDGAWTFDGQRLQLPLSEPALRNASHGLVRWASWHEVSVGEADAVLGYRLMAQSGYPWTLDLTMAYSLTGEGLTVTARATNLSASPAPFAAGSHPYLAVAGDLGSTPLTVPAGRRLRLDDRKLPVGSDPVGGTAYDLREGVLVGDLVVDDCFGDLSRGDDGLARARLGDVELWVDASWRWLQVYTGDTLPSGRSPGTGPRESVAIEPMSAPPDAFSSGEDLVVLEPGASWSGRFGVRRV